MGGLLVTAFERAVDFPGIGRDGRERGTQEILVNPFVVVYRLRDETIEILRILHQRQQWPTKSA